MTPADDVVSASNATRPGFVYWLGRSVLIPIVKLYYRPIVRGAKNVPREGAVILASNHQSFIDSIVIPVLAPRPVRFLAKDSYFTGTGFKGRLSAAFFRSIGAVPVTRGAGQAAQAALDTGKSLLDDQNAFALYPEGTRSLDGRLYRGRTGVAWLALTTGAPVVPVGLIKTDELLPVGAKRPRRVRVTVAFGEPIDLSSHGPATSGRARRHATDQIMDAIAELSGQERADSFNEAPPSGAAERISRVLRPERL
ncbi:MAG: lysophospholipid acyltransferase family protein [Mycetocola sp.]